jgi:hypothetical protein
VVKVVFGLSYLDTHTLPPDVLHFDAASLVGLFVFNYEVFEHKALNKQAIGACRINPAQVDGGTFRLCDQW